VKKDADMKKYKKFMSVSLLGLSLFSFIRYIDNVDYWIVDIFSHFPAQYAFTALVLLFICIWKKYIPLAVISGFLFIFNISAVIDMDKSIEAAGQSKDSFRVYTANIQRHNKDFPRLIRELKEADADIVLLIEFTPEHTDQMKAAIEGFPYHIEFTPIGKAGIGLALLSKFPILDYSTMKLSEFGNSLLEAVLEIDQRKISFYAVHFQNPTFRNDFPERKRQFLRFAEQISEKSVPVIVAGDFNATPYSPIFKKTLKISGLKDSREGFGWQPSWPASFPLLWLPIDHILVSPDIQVHDRATGSHIGSDHYPVFAELSIR
jgi:endonuclease/exonuclease/phosphatase (EEP) superfamily protein YafD